MKELRFLKAALKNEPAFRHQQVFRLIHKNLIGSWDQASNLPGSLMHKLSSEFPLDINYKIAEDSKRDIEKAVIELNDGKKIETVLMRHKDGRNTACVSSQIGCPLGCSFCATGKMGFQRNLYADEIVEQALLFARILKKNSLRLTNIVFMGMGEPLLNYNNVISAIKIVNDKNGLNIGQRSISVSTAGITSGIKNLAKEKLQVNLAVSLHATTDDIRRKIMPIAKNHSIKNLLEAVDLYISRTNRRVMIEYLMIKGLNDSDKDAERLAKLMSRPLVFVNLIMYNQTGVYKPSDRERVKSFSAALRRSRITVTQRHRFGERMNGACGQLAGRGE